MAVFFYVLLGFVEHCVSFLLGICFHFTETILTLKEHDALGINGLCSFIVLVINITS